ncbi:MAG: hypothetical protein [Wendovervirus sonii]|uniref:Uncharacterized protein n=1 Tax=phage Lak_Megaphage_Sonny TaxID=3109229 RepID=A0ABZ0Z344_9CAUD|nr:MAG: hypothetical protein [phage Lak_Megaphage_Sonny]
MYINKLIYERIIDAISTGIKNGITRLDECDGGDCGGIAVDAGTCMYNNGFNTVGMGNVVPAGYPCMTGADFANDAYNGSGDRFDIFYPGNDKSKKTKKKKKNKIKVYSKK